MSGFLAFLTLAAPRPWNWSAAAGLVLCLVALAQTLHRAVAWGPGSPHLVYKTQVAASRNPAFDHMPILLVGPLALLLLLAVTSPWAFYAYPVLLGALWLGALVLPWIRPSTRRAPSLARALGIGGVFR